ncbi:MAG: late competence development ComFB family protein [Lachnospiraceae bacterium]|nr:late competence development ComFB family protein [Lachnospiraceae bacterium]
MAKKTNKTSHVLNLLTNSAPAEDTDTADKKSDVSAHSASSPKVTVVDEGSRNDRVSQEILNHLSEELDLEVPELEEIPEEQPQQPKVQIPKSEPAPQEASAPAAPEAAPQPAPASEDAPQADPVPMVKSGRRLVDQLQDDSFHFINVMEELIMQHDLDTILRQYNVCTCTRCKADVCALTLTGLPPKYVVASDKSLSPVLNYYKNRYKISILAELSKACTVVREHPHHDR